MKRFYVWGGLSALVVVLAVAGYLFYLRAAAPPPNPAFVPVTQDDRTLGSPQAPVQIVEYAAPTCPFCAMFFVDLFPGLKTHYIDTGKVYFVFRVFPLQALDIAAEAMARCLPADRYFAFIDRLYRNQSRWDPDGYKIANVHAALLQMGKDEGLSAATADRCIVDGAQAKRIIKVGADAFKKYGIGGTPAFVVNGALRGPFTDTADMQGSIDPLLAKK